MLSLKDIENTLQALSPSFVKCIDNSHEHHTKVDYSTHIRAVVVSSKFEGLPQLKRHQMVYDCLKEAMEKQIHALSLQTYSPDEWATSNQAIEKDPPCKGGFKK